MSREALTTKVPAVTLGFWVIKIAATTLGETGGDTVSMTMNLGYLTATAIFLTVLVALVVLQIAAKRFHPFLYWATIIASTTAGTTMADYADRSLGIGYTGGSSLLLLCVVGTLVLWYWSLGSISVATVSTPKTEAFYWATITFSQTLGTALGDWLADTSGFGYAGGALVFMAALVVVAVLYYRTSVSHVLLFWAAFILTRPLGATVGDFFDKPFDQGGLNVSRPIATAIIALFVFGCILFVPQRAGTHREQSTNSSLQPPYGAQKNGPGGWPGPFSCYGISTSCPDCFSDPSCYVDRRRCCRLADCSSAPFATGARCRRGHLFP